MLACPLDVTFVSFYSQLSLYISGLKRSIKLQLYQRNQQHTLQSMAYAKQ